MDIAALYQAYLQSNGITTDSRKIEPGQIFFALKGESFDGNTFASKALQAGAKLSVIDNAEFAQPEGTLLVEDVLLTLQQLSHYHRNQFNIPVLGITGSNGKTTTKELINAVLSKKFRTIATIGNLNNHIGVPQTLFRINGDTQLAIIEMGANHVGEIELLSNIAAPTHGLITSIGKAHLGEFGGYEGVKKAKSELYEHLVSHNGIVFLNTDIPVLNEMASRKAVNSPVTYGTLGQNDYHFKFLSAQPFVAFSYKNNVVHSKLIGEYNFNNLMTAYTIGLYFGVDEADIKAALEAYQPSNNRSQVADWKGNMLIMDAYNANPTSMAAALDNFNQMQATQKVLILGDMLELGEYSKEEHQAIADKLSGMDFHAACLTGSEFMQVTNQDSRIQQVPSYHEAGQWLRSLSLNNALMIIKGSRGIQLEKVLAD